MTYRTPVQAPHPHLPLLERDTRTTPDVFGVLFAEVLTPDGQPGPIHLSDWEVRVWPLARLGDATLEARPAYPHLSADDLRRDLSRAGVRVLGPIREKK